mmetsp:Transcript_5067/g.8202  ORF Transcript_5067/g.8202 Transcript_5067/m.8202 type:complete len:207 (-) Transcript_5067:529-1149(-)
MCGTIFTIQRCMHGTPKTQQLAQKRKKQCHHPKQASRKRRKTVSSKCQAAITVVVVVVVVLVATITVDVASRRINCGRRCLARVDTRSSKRSAPNICVASLSKWWAICCSNGAGLHALWTSVSQWRTTTTTTVSSSRACTAPRCVAPLPPPSRPSLLSPSTLSWCWATTTMTTTTSLTITVLPLFHVVDRLARVVYTKHCRSRPHV